MVFVTGDCHADFSRFCEHLFPEQREMTKDDLVIVCGDFGLWHDNAQERMNLDWLDLRPFTTVFVDGNHENFDRLYSDEFELVPFCGGMAHRIRDHIYHLPRGQVFTFEGKTFFTFGGARSHDIEDGILDPSRFKNTQEFIKTYRRMESEGLRFRVDHMSWWEREMPTQEEMDAGLRALAEYGFRVDYIITHCCPQEIASCMGFRDPDVLTRYFNTVAQAASFQRWYFGHYHDDRVVQSRYVLLYRRFERII